MQTSLRSHFKNNKVEAAPPQAKRKLGRPPKEKPIVEALPADLEDEVRALNKQRSSELEEVQQLVAMHQGQRLVAVEAQSQASSSSGQMQLVEVEANGPCIAAEMTKDEWRAQCVKWGALGGKSGRLGGRPRKSEGAYKLTPGRKRVRDESFGPQEKLKMCALMHKLESQFEDLQAMAKHMVVLTSRTRLKCFRCGRMRPNGNASVMPAEGANQA